MDFWDGFHIDNAYIEKDRLYETKTNIKKGILDSGND